MEKSGIFQWLLSMLVVIITGCATGAQGVNVSDEPRSSNGQQRQEAKLEAGIEVKDEEGAKALKPKQTAALQPEHEEELIRKKKEQTKITTGIFRTSVDIVKEQGELGLHFSLGNISGSDREVVFGSGQMYDIVVFNDQKETVYQWSHDKSFIAAIVEKGIKAGEKLAFTEQWDLRDNQGNLVPSGVYVIKVTFLAGIESVNLSTAELTAEQTVEI